MSTAPPFPPSPGPGRQPAGGPCGQLRQPGREHPRTHPEQRHGAHRLCQRGPLRLHRDLRQGHRRVAGDRRQGVQRHGREEDRAGAHRMGRADPRIARRAFRRDRSRHVHHPAALPAGDLHRSALPDPRHPAGEAGQPEEPAQLRRRGEEPGRAPGDHVRHRRAGLRPRRGSERGADRPGAGYHRAAPGGACRSRRRQRRHRADHEGSGEQGGATASRPSPTSRTTRRTSAMVPWPSARKTRTCAMR